MRIKRVTTAAALLALLAACGGQGAQSGQSNTAGGAYDYGGVGSSGSSSASGSSPGAAPASGTISLASTSLGQVLAGPDGRTLYLFTSDGQSASTCYDKCAAAWPPLEINGKPSVGQGLDASKLGETQRKDGSMQVTYNSWPLYYFAKDTKAGDVNGEGIGGIWWAVNAAGDRVQK